MEDGRGHGAASPRLVSAIDAEVRELRQSPVSRAAFEEQSPVLSLGAIDL
jgi:hypothetical protein